MTAKRAINFLLLLAAVCCAGGVRADDTPVTTQIQQVVDDYLAQRRDIESISGVSLYISLGDPGPVIEAFSGDNGRDNKVAIDGDTLFQIGSIPSISRRRLSLRWRPRGCSISIKPSAIGYRNTPPGGMLRSGNCSK
jgi:hypothetical protein